MAARLVLYEEDLKRISEACSRLAREANARMVFVIDRAGQLIAQHGDLGDLDTTAMASLAAGDVAATGGLARLLGEREFPHLFHEGDSESIHLSLLGDKWILVVIFDERSSLGLVRLRVRKFGETLAEVANEITSREPAGDAPSPFADITDEDIDNLFADMQGRTVPFINFPAREVNCKVVYYGPGLGGKTTNIRHIHRTTSPSSRGKLITLDTEAERTLYFDFLPLSLGAIRGLRARFFLYTVPGQVFYEATRRLVLKGADGVVFVADSQTERMDANLESLDDMRSNLVEHGLGLDRLPLVMQYNKRDLPHLESVESLRRTLNPRGVPDFEAVATTGVGVFETLKTAIKGIVRQLRDDPTL